MKGFGQDLSVSRGLEKAIRVGEFKVFKRVDDTSYSGLEEHVAGGAFRADDLDGFE